MIPRHGPEQEGKQNSFAEEFQLLVNTRVLIHVFYFLAHVCMHAQIMTCLHDEEFKCYSGRNLWMIPIFMPSKIIYPITYLLSPLGLLRHFKIYHCCHPSPSLGQTQQPLNWCIWSSYNFPNSSLHNSLRNLKIAACFPT